MLIRLHPKHTHSGHEKQYGFIYLHAPQRAPVFVRAKASEAIKDAVVKDNARNVAAYDSVAELLCMSH